MPYQPNETPSGTVNGVNTIFTLQNIPNPASTLQLYWNGVLQTQGIDYTLSGLTITFFVAPPTGSLVAYYWWGGVVAQLPPAAPPTGGHFTNTLQSVLNFASTHVELLPVTGIGGYLNEPGLSICNDALADLLTAENNWKINRKDYPNFLVTAPFKQDYIWAGSSSFVLGSSNQGWAIALASNSGITVSGGVVTVNTLEPHGFIVGNTVFLNGVVAQASNAANPAAYNSVLTTNSVGTIWTQGYAITAVTASSFSFAAVAGQNNGDILGAPGIFDYGWMQEAYMYMMTDTSAPYYNRLIYAKRQLPLSRIVEDPSLVAVQHDNGDGTLVIRFYMCPGTISWGAKLVYQVAAPLKTDPSQNWSPFPDHYAPLYRQAVLARMYRYVNSPKADAEYKKLQLEIAKAAGFDDNEQTDVTLVPSNPLLDDGLYYGFWDW
jgi:hypothetical protein